MNLDDTPCLSQCSLVRANYVCHVTVDGEHSDIELSKHIYIHATYNPNAGQNTRSPLFIMHINDTLPFILLN